ncbi:hypothetical protein GW17_00012168 [Ensete ventricosum]|nr:hypothetical protein GW17_00012168 [Ensete ventricosum]
MQRVSRSGTRKKTLNKIQIPTRRRLVKNLTYAGPAPFNLTPPQGLFGHFEHSCRLPNASPEDLRVIRAQNKPPQRTYNYRITPILSSPFAMDQIRRSETILICEVTKKSPTYTLFTRTTPSITADPPRSTQQPRLIRKVILLIYP